MSTEQMQTVEHSLVATARGMLAKLVATPENDQAVALAERSRGRVIASEADAAQVADESEMIRQAILRIEKAKKVVLEIPRAMVAAVTDACRSRLDALGEGRKALGDAHLAFVRQQQEAARLAAAAQAREAEERAAAARAEAARVAAEAAATGVAPAPVEEVVPLEAPAYCPPPAMVRGGAGKMIVTSVLKCELANPHECDPAWLKLDESLAKDWFRYQVKTENEKDAPEGRQNAVVVKGVRYWKESTSGTRGR